MPATVVGVVACTETFGCEVIGFAVSGCVVSGCAGLVPGGELSGAPTWISHL